MDDRDQFTKDYHELCLSVGHLFITFARLEGALTAMLKLHLADKMGDISDVENVALSSAIYGAMRFNTIKDTIKRLAVVEDVGQPVIDFAGSIFTQVGHAADLRDKLAHQQLVPAFRGAGAAWQLVDSITTRDIRRPKVFVFDTIAVVSAADDFNTAAHRLGGEAKRGKILNSLARDLSPITWRYKPSMLRLIPLTELRSPTLQNPEVT